MRRTNCHPSSAYAGAAGEAGWQALTGHPAVLDQLDPDAVASDAVRTGFGRYPLPAAIAAVLTVRDRLRRSAPGDRPGVRQLAMARHAGEVRPAGETQPGPAAPGGDWAVRWARLRHEPPQPPHGQLRRAVARSADPDRRRRRRRHRGAVGSGFFGVGSAPRWGTGGACTRFSRSSDRDLLAIGTNGDDEALLL